MSGVELTVGLAVGGWFASSIISNIIAMARSVLKSNNDLQSKTAENLTSLENSLPRIQATIEEASKRPITNRGLITWLDNLKNAAYVVKDVLDDIEAKRIRESLKRKDMVAKFKSSSGKFAKTLIFSDKELKGLESAVENFSSISMGIGDFINILQYNTNANTEHTNTKRRETSSYLDPNLMKFGRDIEIWSILDIILNQITSFSQGKGKETSSTESSVGGLRFFKYIRNWIRKSNGNTSEDGTEDKYQNIASEIERKGKGKEISSTAPRRGVSVRIRNWKLPVLPICGLGGVGKTTIAQMVYNNDIVTEIFDRRAWVYVPANFDRMEIMNEIVRKLGRYITDMEDLDSITHQLNGTIQDKRFFLVLDDVHDGIESIWDDLYSVLRNGAPGSFVLVTTQSEHVAKTIGNMSNIIHLGVLEPEWFDLLFKYYAFGELFNFDPVSSTSSISCRNNVERAQFYNMDEEKLSALKLIATEIAKKLHGLPLAGEVIGKMLHDRLEQVYWEGILKSDWWNEECAVEGILPSLGIGYMDLDPELKQCFAFFSIFPKNYVFDRNRLVQMWMSNDFIQPNKEESRELEMGKIRLEDVGSKRFDKLVEKSFFQATISDGKYVMHDLIRELALVVSSKEFYYVKSLDNHLPISAHHLGIDCDGSKLEGINSNNTSLRTIILFGNWENCSDVSISNIFAKSSSLRVLDLSYIGIEKDISIINAICKLSHLRFVDLSFSKTNFIPNKFCELYHLQVLDVRRCNFHKLPKNMNKLINLRHIYASADTVNLISGIGKLTNLQELEEFRITAEEGHKISELRDMNEIRGHLLIRVLQDVLSKEEAATSQLAKKRYLKSLGLEFEVVVEQEVLDALKPSPSLEMLTIEGWKRLPASEYLPGWISSQNEVSNLKCVKVGNFRVTALPAFGELPTLEVLSFKDLPCIKKIGDEFYGCKDVVFPSLKELTFSKMSCWRAWFDPPVGRKSFPHLKKIHMEFCRELLEMPTNCFTSSMAELKLIMCPNIGTIATVLQRMPFLTHLNIETYYYKLSLYCTALRFLEVLCLRDVSKLCFVGGLKSLVNLKKLEIKQFEVILESFEGEQEHDETSQENQFLTSLLLFHSSSSTQRLPIAGRFGHLRSLLIRKSPVTKYTEEEESWFDQLTSLETLEFSDCQKLTSLPSTLPLLTKLKKLVIEQCRSISSLPEAGLPRNLTELCITGCSDELGHRCQSDEGDDWWKISHIPHVDIKGFYLMKEMTGGRFPIFHTSI